MGSGTHALVGSHAFIPGGSTQLGSIGGQMVHGSPHTLPRQGSQGGGGEQTTMLTSTHAPPLSQTMLDGHTAQLGVEGSQSGRHGMPQGTLAQGLNPGQAMGPVTQLPMPSQAERGVGGPPGLTQVGSAAQGSQTVPQG